MRVVAVAVGLVVVGLLDGSFAGFRASLGRTGLVDHRRSDVVAAARGLGLVAVLLVPAVAVVAVAAAAATWPAGAYARAGTAMLTVYLPYGALVLLAVGAYAVLDWKLKYLASAVILGPFTFARPLVAVAGAVAGALSGADAVVTTTIVLATAAVLTVEPLAGRLWYEPVPLRP